jgi:hypothetical protein
MSNRYSIVESLAAIRRHFIGGYRSRSHPLNLKKSKYTPHQGEQEKARRLRQAAAR